MRRNTYAPCAKTRRAQADAKRRADFERDVWRACVNECNKRARSYKSGNAQWAIYHIGTHRGRRLPDRIMAVITKINGRIMVSTIDKSNQISGVAMYPNALIDRRFAAGALDLEADEFHMARF